MLNLSSILTRLSYRFPTYLPTADLSGNSFAFAGLLALTLQRGFKATKPNSYRGEIAPSRLKTEHFRTEPYGDGLYRTIETAGAAVPALIRILDNRKLLSFIEMDHIQRAMHVAGSTSLALLEIDHRGHGSLLPPLFLSHRGGITS